MKEQRAEISFKRSLALLFAFIFVFSLTLSGCVKSINPQSESAQATEANASNGAQSQAAVSGSDSGESTTQNTAGRTSAFVASDGSVSTGSGSSGSAGSSGSSGLSGGSRSSGSGSGANGGGGSSSGSNSSGSGSAGQSGSGSSSSKSDSGSSKSNSGSGKSAPAQISGSNAPVYNSDTWQRGFGFNAGYDRFTGMVGFNIDEITTYFQYGGKHWLLEFWKGEYEVYTVGSEIGIYYSDNKLNINPRLVHYKAVQDEDALYMSMDLWQCDSSGDRHVLTRSKMRCWWLAAFEPGTLEKHSRRSDLVLVGSVQFKDTQMLDSFAAAFGKKAFSKISSRPTYKNADTYYLDRSSATVYFCWKSAKN